MTIVYLDVDDEITFAASRIRSAEEARVALVLPVGSRLGTSRINFRLLAREAQSAARSLSVVCPEAPTRALAASAGLPVFASVSEYEGSLAASPAEQAAPAREEGTGPEIAAPALAIGVSAAASAGGGAAAGTSPAMPDEGPREPATAEAGDEPPPAAVAPRAGRPASLPVVGGRGGWRGLRTGAIVGIALLAVLTIAVGVGGYLLLPSASVSVVVRPETLGPVDLTVTADPAATTTDPVAGVVPADRPAKDLSASGTFNATGKKVDETKATGSVTFDSINTVGPVRVPSGTRLSTLGGEVFATTAQVIVPPARVAGDKISHGTASVAVQAVKAGPDGNVDADSITQVPAALQVQQVSVSNAAPTSGGSRTETPIVTKKDVDAAVKALGADLDTQLAAAIADPTQLAAGRIVFEDTASRTDAVPTVDPASLVDQEVETFDLGLQATGSVTAVDPEPVRALARQRLLDAVKPGQQLVDGSVRVDLGEPLVKGQAVTFPVTGVGQVVEQVDEAEIRSAISGLPVAEATAILAEYGDATVTVWPDWVTTIPTYGFRLDVSVTTNAPVSPGAGGSTPSGAQTPEIPGSEPP